MKCPISANARQMDSHVLLRILGQDAADKVDNVQDCAPGVSPSGSTIGIAFFIRSYGEGDKCSLALVQDKIMP